MLCMFKIAATVVIEIETVVDVKIIEESEAEVEIEIIKGTEINQNQRMSIVVKINVFKTIILFANTATNAEITWKENVNDNILSKPLKKKKLTKTFMKEVPTATILINDYFNALIISFMFFYS